MASSSELFRAPEIKVKPNQMLEGDHMTLTCDTSLSPHRQTDLQFAFYRDQLTVQNFTLSNQYGVEMIQLKDSGKYYCEAKTLNSNVKKRSKELNIEINELFRAPEIKVKPNQMLEGDHMTLTCDTSLSPHRQTDLQFAFYRDQLTVQNFTLSNQYGVEMVQLKDSGKYYCEAKTLNSNVKRRSDELNIEINELFSHPEIVTNPDFPREGNRVILTCNTSIFTLRNDIKLQFVFYQNEKKVQKLNSSHQYIIPLAQLKDSGNYSCEARTLYNGMKKRSAVVSVVIQGTSSTYLLIICPVTLLLLILAILGFLYMFRQCRSSVNNQDPMAGDPLRTDAIEVNNPIYSALRPKSMRRLAAAQEMSDEPESIYQNT
ncbi:Fc receptor-like protein 5 [Aquarana catesbeiana]|uniref:Fc receptor-like protein 5 n=1 Tax=Aquarana catesbeiana TaxID=8400 RepID=UPI003CC9640E